VGQQARIDGIEDVVGALADRIREQAGESEPAAPEDPPPHY